MKSGIEPALINDPFGDPGLLVQFLLQKRALLFDLGDLSALSNGALLKVSHVFVSHTHIDHFIGFDRLLRSLFGREKTVTIFGPKNIVQNVAGKLAGFTWNLVDQYDESLTFEVVEVRESGLLKGTFRAIERFQLSDERQEPFVDGMIVDDQNAHRRSPRQRVPRVGACLFCAARCRHEELRVSCGLMQPGRDCCTLPIRYPPLRLCQRHRTGAGRTFAGNERYQCGKIYPCAGALTSCWRCCWHSGSPSISASRSRKPGRAYRPRIRASSALPESSSR